MFKSFKSKLAVVGASALVFANSAMAAGVSISSDGAVSGELDKTTFMGMAGVVVLALGAFWAVRQGLRLIR